MEELVLFKDGAAVTILPELADYYKAMGWSEEEPKAKAQAPKKKSAKTESET